MYKHLRLLSTLLTEKSFTFEVTDVLILSERTFGNKLWEGMLQGEEGDKSETKELDDENELFTLCTMLLSSQILGGGGRLSPPPPAPLADWALYHIVHGVLMESYAML